MKLLKIIVLSGSLVIAASAATWAVLVHRTLHTILETQAAQLNFDLQLQRDNVELMRAQEDMREQLEEYQEWRLHITVASRMGWAQSARYIRQFPIKDHYPTQENTYE